MIPASTRRDPRVVVLAILGVAVVLGGLGLAMFGIGAELQEERAVTLKVLATMLPEEAAVLPAEGDPVYTDPAGMLVGHVSEAVSGPYELAVPDAEGKLHLGEDPTRWQVMVTIEATGREGDGIVSVGNEVIQAGQTFNVISREYFLRGTVVSVDVQ